MFGKNHSERLRLVAEEMNEPIEQIKIFLEMYNSYIHLKSLDEPINDDEDSSLSDIILAENQITIEDIVVRNALREQLAEVLSTLTNREKIILKLRFGLEDGKARTLDEIGKIFNVTRERIRQIEKKALKKLRHPSRSEKLKDFI